MIIASTSAIQNIFRIILATAMLFAGVAHLTFGRAEFQAQVPHWIPVSKDVVVILSGIVEVAFGLTLIIWTSQRAKIGIALAIFFVFIFPGNIAQYMNGTDAFGLDTDQARLIRLFFQPVLIVWALWSTGAFRFFKKKRTSESLTRNMFVKNKIRTATHIVNYSSPTHAKKD